MNRYSNRIERNVYVCATCNKVFHRLASQVRTSTPFCSKSCHYAFVRPLAERFWEKVRKTDDCWTWIGQKTSGGYGRLDEKDGSVLLAHRASWQLQFGEIPPGKHVLHHCDNPICVNPAHLFLGTQRDNNSDKIAKGRQAKGIAFPHAKLTPRAVRLIRERYQAGEITQDQLAAEFGVSSSRISYVVNRKEWHHVI